MQHLSPYVTEPVPGIMGLETGLDKGTALEGMGHLSSRGGRGMSSYRTVRSAGFYGTDYVIEQKEHWSPSLQVCGWEGDSAWPMGSATFCRILDNFINPSGPLLIKRIVCFCCTCPPHLEKVRGVIRWKGVCREDTSVLRAVRR